jgi:hypothetical protein
MITSGRTNQGTGILSLRRIHRRALPLGVSDSLYVMWSELPRASSAASILRPSISVYVLQSNPVTPASENAMVTGSQ